MIFCSCFCCLIVEGFVLSLVIVVVVVVVFLHQNYHWYCLKRSNIVTLACVVTIVA